MVGGIVVRVAYEEPLYEPSHRARPTTPPPRRKARTLPSPPSEEEEEEAPSEVDVPLEANAVKSVDSEVAKMTLKDQVIEVVHFIKYIGPRVD